MSPSLESPNFNTSSPLLYSVTRDTHRETHTNPHVHSRTIAHSLTQFFQAISVSTAGTMPFGAQIFRYIFAEDKDILLHDCSIVTEIGKSKERQTCLSNFKTSPFILVAPFESPRPWVAFRLQTPLNSKDRHF